MNGPRVAVVILNWNGERFLREYLPSVVKNTPRKIADVIVADNGSTDSSISVLKKDFPDVRLIEFSENHGFAEGYNLAIGGLADEYKYTVLLNSDVRVDDDWLTPLYDFMESHPKVGAVQPKILSLSDQRRIFESGEADCGQYDAPLQVDWASGAALMVDTALYIKVGGLDKEFFAHMEEIDLCWRMRLAGRELWAVPQAKVYHLGGGSLPASNPKKTYLNFRNNLLMLYKNLPHEVRGRRLLWRRMPDILAWAKFIATFDMKNASALVRAHRDFARMRLLYPDGSLPEKNGRDLLASRPNILVEYYLKGKRLFSEL